MIHISGTILDEDLECTLNELCRICNIEDDIIHEMIEEGLIRPSGSEPTHWRFTAIEIRRVQTSLRLQRDLRINLPGCALILDLLDELEELRCQTKIR